MTDKIFADVVVVATAIVGLATFAVFLSNKADTANVISTAGTAFGNVIKEAVSPITGTI